MTNLFCFLNKLHATYSVREYKYISLGLSYILFHMREFMMFTAQVARTDVGGAGLEPVN